MEQLNLELVCKASNPLIKDAEKVVKKTLDLNCKLWFVQNKYKCKIRFFIHNENKYFSDSPLVMLILGKSIASDSIYEGGDVYFDCLVKSKPQPTKILWYLNVRNN